MRKRTKSRVLALQFLYRIDITKEEFPCVLSEFWREHKAEKEVKDFAIQLIQGTQANLARIDSVITKYAQNWQLKRMAVIDRNILRLGCFELLFLEDVPPKVAINEAVELAKRYGDTESSKFVNGILDKIHNAESR
ncbi:MAG: transcription antitermination factor NusB [Candidatus Omnitrophota bacterium]|nr:MAG: transcription antitermination factor NusB [Candidatus Omnitrophota bacterium]